MSTQANHFKSRREAILATTGVTDKSTCISYSYRLMMALNYNCITNADFDNCIDELQKACIINGFRLNDIKI